MHSRRVTAGLLGLVLAGWPSGCGRKAPTDPEQSARQAELKQIWEVYTSYVNEKKRAPTRLADVKGYGTAFSEGMRALREGRCVVVWGVADPTGAAAKQVLAYEKDVPEQGGQVLFGDGSVTRMTAEEFQAAPKAGA